MGPLLALLLFIIWRGGKKEGEEIHTHANTPLLCALSPIQSHQYKCPCATIKWRDAKGKLFADADFDYFSRFFSLQLTTTPLTVLSLTLFQYFRSVLDTLTAIFLDFSTLRSGQAEISRMVLPTFCYRIHHGDFRVTVRCRKYQNSAHHKIPLSNCYLPISCFLYIRLF